MKAKRLSVRSAKGRLRVGLFAGVFAIFGVATLLATRAVTPTASVEPENGTRSSNVTVTTAAGASGGSAVQFTEGASSGACPAFPAFPDANCTGPPAGYSLTTVNGDFTTTANGQVVDGRLITGDLNVEHNNVTVTNTRIMGMVWARDKTGLTLRKVDLGPDQCPAAAGQFISIFGANGFTIIQSRIHHNAADLIAVGGGQPIEIRDSILDRTCYYPGAHLDAVQFYDPGGVGTISIIHSVLDVRPANNGGLGNAAIQWGDSPGAGTRLVAYHNKFAGGNYTTQFGDAPNGSNIILDVHDNIYVKNSYQYGPCASGNTDNFNGIDGLKFINNKLDDGTPASC